MNNRMLVGIAASLAVTGLAFQTAKLAVDEEVEGKYVTQDGKSVEILGVCSITPDQIDCWDVKGAKAPDLAESIKGRMARNDGTEVSFKYGKKNRVVVYRSDPTMNFEFSTLEGNSFNSLYWSDGGNSALRGFRVAVDKNVELLAAVGTYPIEPLVAEVPLSEGGKGEANGASYQIGAIRHGKLPKNLSGDPYGRAAERDGSFWQVVISAKGQPERTYGASYAVLDRNRKPIRYVDLKGRPLTSVEYLALGGRTTDYYNPQPEASKKEKPRCTVATALTGESTGDAFSLWINVDPKQAAYLTVSVPKRKRVLFKGIPLDPKD